MANIAIFGGTFNPFHIGHYEMLKHTCELAFIDKVFVTPDKIPPHKTCDFLASDSDRIEMCRIICEDFSKAEICLIEFEREGKSYTVDTLLRLKQLYPNDTFYTVIGGDMLATLDRWYNYEKLFKLTNFIAFSRHRLDSFEADISKMRELGAEIIPLDFKITDISSTTLRKNAIKTMLPQKIYEFIKDKGIYND